MKIVLRTKTWIKIKRRTKPIGQMAMFNILDLYSLSFMSIKKLILVDSLSNILLYFLYGILQVWSNSIKNLIPQFVFQDHSVFLLQSLSKNMNKLIGKWTEFKTACKKYLSINDKEFINYIKNKTWSIRETKILFMFLRSLTVLHW